MLDALLFVPKVLATHGRSEVLEDLRIAALDEPLVVHEDVVQLV